MDEPVLAPPRQPRTPHSREHGASRKRRTPGNVEHQLDEVDEPVLAPPRQPPEHPPSNVELPGTSSFLGTSSTSSMKWTSRCPSLPGRCYPSRAHLAVIGSRRSRPKPRCVTRGPIGAWRRLYSLRSTRVSTLCTSSASKPALTMSSAD